MDVGCTVVAHKPRRSNDAKALARANPIAVAVNVIEHQVAEHEMEAAGVVHCDADAAMLLARELRKRDRPCSRSNCRRSGGLAIHARQIKGVPLDTAMRAPVVTLDDIDSDV